MDNYAIARFRAGQSRRKSSRRGRRFGKKWPEQIGSCSARRSAGSAIRSTHPTAETSESPGQASQRSGSPGPPSTIPHTAGWAIAGLNLAYVYAVLAARDRWIGTSDLGRYGIAAGVVALALAVAGVWLSRRVRRGLAATDWGLYLVPLFSAALLQVGLAILICGVHTAQVQLVHLTPAEFATMAVALALCAATFTVLSRPYRKVELAHLVGAPEVHVNRAPVHGRMRARCLGRAEQLARGDVDDRDGLWRRRAQRDARRRVLVGAARDVDAIAQHRRAIAAAHTAGRGSERPAAQLAGALELLGVGLPARSEELGVAVRERALVRGAE